MSASATHTHPHTEEQKTLSLCTQSDACFHSLTSSCALEQDRLGVYCSQEATHCVSCHLPKPFWHVRAARRLASPRLACRKSDRGATASARVATVAFYLLPRALRTLPTSHKKGVYAIWTRQRRVAAAIRCRSCPRVASRCIVSPRFSQHGQRGVHSIRS